MSFQDSVSYECGSKFLKLYDCQLRQQRLQKQGAPEKGPTGDPCERPRMDMTLCMASIYVESVCCQPLHELSKCAKEAELGSSVAKACHDQLRTFERCSEAAMEGPKADAAFQVHVLETNMVIFNLHENGRAVRGVN